jgi:glycosyltransferase involved in cell wall biosynthesis
MTPLVSVIVPCYNARPWVEGAVESALSQSWAEVEVIVVNDGSTDGSMTVLRGLEGPRVKVVDQPNRGASAARNVGLSAAKGQYIQFLDADDLLAPGKLLDQVSLLAVSGPMAVATARWARFKSDPAYAVTTESSLFRDMDPLEYLISLTSQGTMMHPAAYLVPAEVIGKAGPWNESLSLNDDGEYFSRVVLAARKVVHAPRSLSLYRSGLDASLSRRTDRAALESFFMSCDLVATHLLAVEDSDRIRRALADYFQRLAYEVYPSAPDLFRRAQARSESLGGSAVRPEMGRRQQMIANIFGWKLARRAARFLRR